MNVGLIDADLLDGKSNFPNLALMKLSTHHKQKGDEVDLITSYFESYCYDTVYISKVFTSTIVPEWVLNQPNIQIGGTGFFGAEAKDLPSEVEHSTPDYNLYCGYIRRQILNGDNPKKYDHY